MTILLLLSSQPLSGLEAIARPATRLRTYVQGATVKIWVDVIDSETRLPITEVDDVIATISTPDGGIDTRRLTDSLVDTDTIFPGRYWCVVDTTPIAGSWVYQFAVIGDDTAVAKARFHVREALPSGI